MSLVIRSVLVCFFLGSFALSANESAAPHLRFVITGNLRGIHTGESDFFASKLFRLGDTETDFAIEQTNLKAFRQGNTLYFSLKPFEVEDLLSLDTSEKSVPVQGLLASSFYGFALNDTESSFKALQDSFLSRELEGVHKQFNVDVRKKKGITFFAVSLSEKNTLVLWPKSKEGLIETHAVVASYQAGKQRLVFLARQTESTARVFGIVDQLLSDTSVPTRYLDLGNTLGAPGRETLSRAKQMLQLLLKRNPAVLASARYDLSFFKQDPEILQTAPYLAPVTDLPALPSSRVVKLGGRNIQFSAIYELSEGAYAFLPSSASLLSLDASIKKAKKSSSQSSPDLMFGLASRPASTLGIVNTSAAFDLIFSLALDETTHLPAVVSSNLKPDHEMGIKPVAPLVRISSNDVTELLIWVDAQHQIQQIEIHRHPVVGTGREASDAKLLLTQAIKNEKRTEPALPSKPAYRKSTVWTQQDFNQILGHVLLSSVKNAELSIVDERPAATPIYSEVPFDLAKQLISREGRAVSLTLDGRYIKKIFKAIKENQFGIPVVLFGGLLKDGTIQRRPIDTRESYRLVVTEEVLLAIDRFMAREALSFNQTAPASTVQLALQEGSKDALKILSEVRKREAPGSATRLPNTEELIYSSPTVSQLVDEHLGKGLTFGECLQVFREAPGRMGHVLVFDVSDLDFGLKSNAVNDTLTGWKEEIAKTNIRGSFTEPRFWDNSYLNILLYLKTALKYAGPNLDSELSGSIKYFQTNSESKDDLAKIDKFVTSGGDRADFNRTVARLRPAKDSLKVEGEIRLPLDRAFDDTPSWTWMASPVAHFTYETQVWPNVILSSIPRNLTHVVHDSRLLLGVSAKPAAGDELYHFGALLGYDLSRDTAIQSFAYGVEAAFANRWALGPVNLRFETNARQLFPVTIPDKGRMGLVWLADGKIEIPIYDAFSVAAMVNFTMGTRMDEPMLVGTSTVLGVAVSYGDRFKWLL